MSSITVLLTDGDLAAPVVEVLSQWVAGGVCREFLYVHGDRASVDATAQPATVVGADGPDDADLFTWLANNHHDFVRLLTVHVVTADDADRARPDRTSDDIELAYSIRARLGDRQELVHLNLIIPNAGVAGLDPSIAQVDLALNLVVAPEDRAAPGTFALPLDGEGEAAQRFVTHAAVDVAAVGALWAQAEVGPFDDSAQGGVAEARVIRSFLRLLDGPDPLPELVTLALNPTDASGNHRWPPPSHSNTTDAGAARPFLHQAYDDTLGQGGRMFDFRPAPARARPPRQVVTIGLALRMLFSFLWSRLRNIVPEQLAQVEAHIIRRLNRLGQNLVGEDSQLLVRFGGRLTVDDALSKPLDADELVESASVVVDLIDGLERYLAPTQAEEWDNIRGAMMGLVDGSTMPEGYHTPLTGDVRPVILDVGTLVTHPLTEPLVITGLDAGRTDVGRITLSPFDPYATDQLIAHVESLPPVDEETSRTRAQVLQNLKTWRDQRAATLLWGVGSHLGRQLDTARATLVQALEELRRGKPRPADDALADEARRAFRWIMIGLLIAVCLAVAASFGLPALGVATNVTIGIVIALFVGWFVAAVWRHLKYLHFEFKLRYQREQAVTRFEQAADDVEQCSRELIRLGSLYWQYERWSEIIGHLLHRPWGDMPSTKTEPSSLVVTSPPLSCRVGTATLDPEKLKPIAADLRLAVFIVGWLRKAYREAEEYGMERIARDGALDRAPTLLDDRLQASNQSLDGFLTVLRRGDHWRATVSNREGDAAKQLLRRRPSDLFDAVQLPSGETYPDQTAGETDPIDGLLEELLGVPNPEKADPLGSFGAAVLAVEGAPPVERSIVGRPDSMALAPEDRFEALDERTIAPTWRPGRILFSVVRVDASQRLEPEQLSLLRAPARRADPKSPPSPPLPPSGAQEPPSELDDDDEGD